MRNLVEAVVEASKRHGVVAILVSGEGNGNGHAPLPAGASADADLVARYNATLARVQALEAEGKQAQDAIVAARGERDLFGSRLREHEATITALRAGGAVTAGGTTAPVGGTLDSQSIDILGIEDEVAKKLKKKEWGTVGQLREALLAGKLASEAKLAKDAIIAVSWALLGKVPPMTLPAGAPAAVVPSATPGMATDVPTGLTDRPWKERLLAARKKERDRKAIEQKVIAATAQMNGTADPAARAEIQKQITNDTGTLDVLGGQVFCLLWACGLCAPGTFKSVKEVSVDAALTSAGLVHLVETLPTQAASPPQPTAPQA